MISAVNQFLETFDGLGNAIMPTEPRWGFAATPSLQQLQQQHSRQHDMSPDSHSDVPTSYVHQLERDHAFISNHCVAAMAQQLTVSEYTDNLSGTVLAPQLPDAAATDAALQSIREQVDGAWSKEAVWRGVGYAKSGDYEQAMECYGKALLLNRNNCDAYVARGAAHANQKHFSAALHDFRTALKLDPGNVNAAKYMQATEQHAQAAAAAAAAEQRGGGAKLTPLSPPPPAAAGRVGVAADSSKHAAATAAEQAGSRQHFDRQEKQQRGHRPDSPARGRQQQQQQQEKRQEQEPCRAPRVEDREPGNRNEQGRQRQQQQQQRQDRQHSYKYASRSRSPASRKRRRSKSSDGSTSSGGSSSSSSSSSTSQSDSDGAGAAGEGLQRPSIADIQEAIQVLRSEQRHKKRTKKDHHKRGNKKAKRKRKHGGHKHHKSKHKHKSRH